MRKKIRNKDQNFEQEVSSLISMGLLQYLIDEDGNFCYELTDEGYRVARGETVIEDYEKEKK